MEKAYLEWIKQYTNNDFVNKNGIEIVPEMINIVIAEMIAFDEANNNKSAESLGDYSVTFDTSDYGYNKKTLAKLAPYIKRKVKFV